MPDSYSIQLRVKRTTIEDAYVSVPVTQEIMKPQPDEKGNYSIDFDAFVKKGVELAANSQVDWKVEKVNTAAHDVQQPLPDGRTTFDPLK